MLIYRCLYLWGREFLANYLRLSFVKKVFTKLEMSTTRLISGQTRLKASRVFMVDGKSEHVAHVWTETGKLDQCMAFNYNYSSFKYDIIFCNEGESMEKMSVAEERKEKE